MDVLIKNMEMPKSCFRCQIQHCAFAVDNKLHTIKADDCPLVELPPHGRLIDADAFATYYADLEADNGEYTEDAGETLRTIQNAPTVLEAST